MIFQWKPSMKYKWITWDLFMIFSCWNKLNFHGKKIRFFSSWNKLNFQHSQNFFTVRKRFYYMKMGVLRKTTEIVPFIFIISPKKKLFGFCKRKIKATTAVFKKEKVEVIRENMKEMSSSFNISIITCLFYLPKNK